MELDDLQSEENRIMTNCRVGVEWSFGKVTTEQKFIDFFKGMKLQLSTVSLYYKFAVLITNAHTCLYGSQHVTYFNIRPPTLSEYFGNPNIPL
jgi:hypothetical protein